MCAMKRALLAVVSVAMLSGCAAAVVGAAAVGAGYVWYNGALRATLDAPLPEVGVATRRGLDDLDFVGIFGRTDKLRGTVRARMSDGTKIQVKLEAADLDATQVTVRVGTFGDKSISRQIMRHIESRLGTDDDE